MRFIMVFSLFYIAPVSLFFLFQLFCALSIPILLGYRYFFHSKKEYPKEEVSLEEMYPKNEKGLYPWETEKNNHV
ncbi:hypothetical protein [Listeria seeligeri]|uniref:hypothetical protein n=1 Tax=Listeria seeligeri TaxID=1640 RepID=UPI00162718E1|nr:hypothetical protein [Listeria seeligeri]MBC1538947.1 hypothetical protein [Listeria seeligeri]MBC1556563.1 hypothetical protein [Listeria seeligeri]